MNLKQQTIKSPVSVEGVGLHTGAVTKLTFLPANADHGIKFKRVDLEGQPIIEADVDYVVDTSRGTTLEKNGARISTVEHVLAALVGLQIDNILIEVDNIETPIMDGSSIKFIEALESVGFEEQNAFRDYFDITGTGINYKDETRGVEIQAVPADEYRVTVMVDYNSPVLGSQYSAMYSIKEFKTEFAASRTFCFLHELQQLHKAGLVKGGDFNNAIVVVDEVPEDEELQKLAVLFDQPRIEVNKGYLNNLELRFKNEPARHKLLDVIGDLALIGRPIKGHILSARPGHAANVAFAKIVKAAIKAEGKKKAPSFDPNATPLLDSKGIYEALPHAHPFKMVDKIIHLDHKSVVGVKNISITDPVFTGHFPDNPIYPGVLLLESIAQVGGIFVLNTVEDPSNYWTYFMGVNNCKFRQPVKPGDTVVIKCELLSPIRRGIANMMGYAYVGNNLVCEAEVLANIVKKQ